MTRNATLDQIKSYRTSVTTALLDQHRRKGLGMLDEATTPPTSTPAQRSYLADLLGQLYYHAPKVHADAMAWINGLGGPLGLDRTDASRAIAAVKRHLAAPSEVVRTALTATSTATVYAEVRIALENVSTDTRYALEVGGEGSNDWRFYRVYTAMSGTKVIKVGHANGADISWERLGAHAQLIAAARIATDPREAMLNFGRKIGRCGHCGRVLTNQASREAGIGPICAGK